MGEQKVKTIEGEAVKTAPAAGKSKKAKRKALRGRIYIYSSYNNTRIAVTDADGEVLAWSSAGLVGFKGSRKSTPYAAQKAMEDLLVRTKTFEMKEADVFIRGIGSGRESAVRALQGSGMIILSIKDLTPIPHGGVRAKKPRRV